MSQTTTLPADGDTAAGPTPGTRRALAARLEGRRPETIKLVGYFAFAHLPPHLREVSMPICVLALEMALTLPDGPELTKGLNELLAAKDWFVRAAVLPEDD